MSSVMPTDTPIAQETQYGAQPPVGASENRQNASGTATRTATITSAATVSMTRCTSRSSLASVAISMAISAPPFTRSVFGQPRVFQIPPARLGQLAGLALGGLLDEALLEQAFDRVFDHRRRCVDRAGDILSVTVGLHQRAHHRAVEAGVAFLAFEVTIAA